MWKSVICFNYDINIDNYVNNVKIKESNCDINYPKHKKSESEDFIRPRENC